MILFDFGVQMSNLFEKTNSFKPANNNLLEVVDGGFQIHKGSRSADETLRDLGT